MAARIHRGTLQNWIRRGLVVPPQPILFRGKFTRLWTSAQVEDFRALRRRLERGRRAKINASWADAERKAEQARRVTRRYSDRAERDRTSAAVKKALADDPCIVRKRTEKARRTSRTRKSRFKRSNSSRSAWTPARRRVQSENLASRWQDTNWANRTRASITAAFTPELRAQMSRTQARRYAKRRERLRTAAAVTLALRDPETKARHDEGRVRAAETLLRRKKAKQRGRPVTKAAFYRLAAIEYRRHEFGCRKLAKKWDPDGYRKNPDLATSRMRLGIKPYLDAVLAEGPR